MKKIIFLFGSCILAVALSAQTITAKLKLAFQKFENDPQLKHAISSLYVIDAKTGKVVFDKNSQIGLAGASTQKIFTATTAFELLGKDYRFKTVFFGNENRVIVSGLYDPTFGSWRYSSTTDTAIFETIATNLQAAGINKLKELIVYNNDLGLPPGGWINDDIGNYYGAAIHQFNWKENQYDLAFIPGKKVGDPAEIDTSKTNYWWEIVNGCRTGPIGSGDKAYIYFIPGNILRVVEGTIPVGVKDFSIAGADSDPARTFSLSVQNYLSQKKIFIGEKGNFISASPSFIEPILKTKPLFSYYSPPLDSIIYWFLKKSINLYGEALVKTLAYEKNGFDSTDDGVDIVKNFWEQRGIEKTELNIMDGSGLSPQNRLTTHAQVEVLKYAKSKDWFPYFYDALPEYNNMKMKSGTISGVKGFTGYQTSKKGEEFIFSFLVNNYNGSPSALVEKMYKVLNILK